jgi:SAM-dependent methyltransferase
MRCILCGADAPLLFSHKGFDLHWCSDCDLGRLAGDFTPEQVACFYADNYYTHAPDVPRAELTGFEPRLLRHLAWRADYGSHFDVAELPKARTVCDIGCGNGDNLRHMKAIGLATTGVEPDPRAREAASNAGDIVAGTAEQVPPLGKFDIVFSSHVLEHCIDPILAINNTKAMVAPGGTLIIEVPNNAAMAFRWFGGKWPWADIPRHLSFFTEKSLCKLLAANGLRATKTIYCGYTKQFLPPRRERCGHFIAGWPLLAATVLAPDRLKYDSVRVHAKVNPSHSS